MLGSASAGVTEKLSVGQLQASRYAHALKRQGPRPLSPWVSSQDRDCAEGHRGPLQSLLGASAGAENGGDVGQSGWHTVRTGYEQDLCSPLGARDESHSCRLVRPHSLLRETDPGAACTGSVMTDAFGSGIAEGAVGGLREKFAEGI